MAGRIVVRLTRPKRRRLERWARKSGDGDLRVRVQIVVLYSRGRGCQFIAEALGVVPSTAVRVVTRYLETGEQALVDGRSENGMPVVDDDLVGALAELVVGSPEDHGWSRPTWTRELLVEALERVTGVGVSVSTLARMLRRLGAHSGTARPSCFAHGQQSSANGGSRPFAA